MYRETLLDKMNRKIGRYAIPNLMSIVVGGMGLVYLLDFIIYPMTEFSLTEVLAFDSYKILHHWQLWRLVTFIFIPPNNNVFFIIFSLYFYWMIGSAIEKQWGSFRFNVYYFCGMVGTMIAGLLTGYATNYYLNLSLFIAFALLYPDYQLVIMYILPVKAKYLALIDGIGLLIMFFTSGWRGKVVLLVALANIALFFWRNAADAIRDAKRRHDFNKSTGNYWKNQK